MTMTGEYHTGMIRSSLMAAPKRLPVLWAKLLVFSAVTFVLMLIAAFIGFLGAQALYTEHHVNAGLEHPRSRSGTIFGVTLYMTATAALSVALGTIVRRTAGGIALFVGVFWVLPGLIETLPQTTADAIHPYLPNNAGGGIAQAVADSAHVLGLGRFRALLPYTSPP